MKIGSSQTRQIDSGPNRSLLPRSFRHAIVVTRYLWIDSLCIIQDDNDDWLRESKAMGIIYQQA